MRFRLVPKLVNLVNLCSNCVDLCMAEFSAWCIVVVKKVRVRNLILMSIFLTNSTVPSNDTGTYLIL